MTMKMSKLALAIGALVMAGGAMAQSIPTATAGAAATIIAPLKLTKTADLSFGNIAPGNNPGTVILTTGAGRSVTGLDGPTLPPTQTGTVTAAAFDVAGQGAYTYAITLPAAAVTLDDGSGDHITVDTFTVATGGTGTVAGTVGTLAAGLGNLKVGATLNVGATQTAGTYTGSFDVTVAYN